MTDNFGSGVSRVLDPAGTEYLGVLWQQSRPPLDSELTLIAQIATEWDRAINLSNMPSGWIGDETGLAQDFVTNPAWSNWFKFGAQRSGETRTATWANVNGWLIPVTGTRTGAPPGSPDNSSTWNLIALPPAPANSGDHRTDFVFLEVWKARVAPNPASANKPAANAVWRYGNVEGGMSFIPDDIKDPAIGFETTQRIQLQYRIRVVSGVLGLTQNPDGFDPTTVKAKGAYDPTNPDTATSFVFTNMRTTLGDPGLWRAGDGTQNALGTVDGYVYAIPIALVFRRNGVAWNGHPSQNLNGSINRNPTAVDRTGIKTFTATATLAADLTASALTATLVTSAGIPLPLNPATPLMVKIGNEVLTYSIISGATLTILARGAKQTRAEIHKAGSTVTLYQERPDGLWADQVAETDLLDLRHAVNPNGFDYHALLLNNLDLLLKGNLRSVWKYTGTGPQGTFLPYQDVIANAAPSLGTTKLDGPDGFRQVWSDAAVTQKVDIYINPAVITSVTFTSLNVPYTLPTAQTIGASWDIPATINLTGVANPTPGVSVTSPIGKLQAGDVITIPVAQFKSGVISADQDQVRFVYDSDPNALQLFIEGVGLVDPSFYTITPTNPTPADDLKITLGTNFPTIGAGSTTGTIIRVVATVLYGSGRGLARKPSAVHSICAYNPTRIGQTAMMVQSEAVPDNNIALRVSYLPLWAKENGNIYRGMVPAIAEAYGDLGSKTVVLTPFRRTALPGSALVSYDGRGINIGTAAVVFRSGTHGSTGVTWGNVLTDTTVDFTTGSIVTAGMRVVISTGIWSGSFVVTQTPTATQLTLDRPLPPGLTNGVYSIYSTGIEGLMPLKKLDGTTSKWAVSDPLSMFSGHSDGTLKGNIFTVMPRHLTPGWGAVYAPIQWNPANNTPAGNFDEGANYLFESRRGQVLTGTNPGYVAYLSPTGADSFGVFSTLNMNLPMAPAVYNQAFTWSGHLIAGMRKFNDTPDITRPTARGLGRKGLELPPYYGIARLFAVYEANNYAALQSSFDPNTRDYLGTGATNLLRQNFDGPTFWIEVDDDGDSTFILNADAIDTSKSPTPISFDTADFVIEASIFGVDRGSFLPGNDCRVVLSRDRAVSQSGDPANRDNNVNRPLATAPTLIIPTPPKAGDTFLVNYSRVPYQGDCWQSQSNGVDVGYYPGPVSTTVAYQISSTRLDQANLARPNQKVLEVLASVGFTTTLGTGRLSGFSSHTKSSFWSVAAENPAYYPPTSQVQARPPYLTGALTTLEAFVPISTEYLGATSNLPMGSLFRDKDFRGGFIGVGASDQSALAILGGTTIPSIFAGGLARKSTRETKEILLDNSSMASGAPGEILVQVDGNPDQGSYTQLTNFRTYRGGSAFSGDGNHPGGELYCSTGILTQPTVANVLACRALLVRNVPTNVGASEVSAGDELMMLIVSTATRFDGVRSDYAKVVIGTNGTGEGSSASDLYRLSGHPLMTSRSKVTLDPSTVTLSKAFDIGV